MNVVMVVQGEANLSDVVLALNSPMGLASGLDSRQQEGHQDADDGNDDKEFNQSKCSPFRHNKGPFGMMESTAPVPN